jgi:putative CocE/NonD family hydrolase
MPTRLLIALLLLLAATCLPAQEPARTLDFPQAAITDETELAKAIPALARQAIPLYRDTDRDAHLGNLFRLQLAAGQYTDSVATIAQWRAQDARSPSAEPPSLSLAVRLYAQTLALEAAERLTFEAAWRKVFRDTFIGLDDRTAYDAAWSLGTLPDLYRQRLQALLNRQKEAPHISLPDAIQLIRAWTDYDAYRSFAPLLEPLVAEDETRRYIIQKDVLIRTRQGATLSAVVVRSRRGERQPAALRAVIQTSLPRALQQATFAASRGYVGVGSDTRGKRLSPDDIVLFEHDAEDLYGVIDWISKQPWSDGQVGMYGGSNAGFTQWAAAKSLHPALKTIVPYCPLDPGYGLPMNNNVFITANYDALFFLGNTKETDERFAVPGRANAALLKWYQSGRPYREIDQVDGNPNKWLQKFLQHPAYDEYWQSLTANGKDYRKLNIPILAIDGYYDDGQNNAVRRLREHYRYRSNAEHYLVIGPYTHFETQGRRKSTVQRDYVIDPVAQFDTEELTFQWFDYVLKRGVKPAMLKDKINFQVMGANVWRHAPSIEAMSSEKLTLYFTSSRSGEYLRLVPKQPTAPTAIKQTVNFADRSTTSVSTYPSAIVSKRLDLKRALAFISEPFDTPVSIDGLISARMRGIFNKKDLDIAMVVYEVTPAGEFFHLTYTVQRASFAKDMTRRQLLKPYAIETIPLDNMLLVSRQLSAGSRVLVVIDVNRGTDAQVNYGTGKDVSDESVADAGEPLMVEWLNESTVTLPISR